MTVGMPGTGLGGLFIVLSTLLMPFFQLGRALTGRAEAGAWRTIGRALANAVGMILAIDATSRIVTRLLAAGGGRAGGAVVGDVAVLPVSALLLALALLALLLVLGGIAAALLGPGSTSLPEAARASAVAAAPAGEAGPALERSAVDAHAIVLPEPATAPAG